MTPRNKTVKIIGWGSVTPDRSAPSTDQFDCGEFLKEKKAKKLMSLRDQLSLTAAGRALIHAGMEFPLSGDVGRRAGIYLTAGYLGFEGLQLHKLAEGSVKNGVFSMESFSETYRQLNPLLTFKCLPNMAIFHISRHFGIHGSYFSTYPGGGQFFQGLKQACRDLTRGSIETALVGAVAEQRNPLVQNHVRKRKLNPELLNDTSVFFVLSSRNDYQVRALIDPPIIGFANQKECESPTSWQRGASDPGLKMIEALEKVPDHRNIFFSETYEDGVSASVDMRLL